MYTHNLSTQRQVLAVNALLWQLEFFFFFLATSHSLWDLSSPTRDRSRPPAVETQNLNPWTTKEFPANAFRMDFFIYKIGVIKKKIPCWFAMRNKWFNAYILLKTVLTQNKRSTVISYYMIFKMYHTFSFAIYMTFHYIFKKIVIIHARCSPIYWCCSGTE